MKKIAFLSITIFMFSFVLIAQEKLSCEGKLIIIGKDSVLTISYKNGQLPAKGQLVKVYKSFQMKGMKLSGTIGVANGKVLSASKSMVRVQVTLYTSTKTEGGKRVPLIKKGENTILKWEGIAKKEDTFSANFSKAMDLKKAGKYKDAVEAYTKALAEKNKHFKCLFDRAFCYYKLRKYNESLQDINGALKINPSHGQAIYIRAHIYGEKRRYLEAAKDILSLLDKNLTAKERLSFNKKGAYWKLKAGDSNGACEIITKLKATSPDDIDVINFYNKNCAKIDVPKSPTKRLDFEVVSQSENGFNITAIIAEKMKECYDGGLTYGKPEELKTGQVLKSSSCSAKSNMSTAVLKIISVNKGTYTLEVLFWQNSIGNSPWVKKYKQGDVFMSSW